MPVPRAYNYLVPDFSEIRELVQIEGGGLAHCRLPAGGVSKAVRHQTVEEMWFFLSGEGEVWRKLGDRSKVVPVRAGVSLAIPVGASFQFRTTGHEPLDFVIATIPRWPGPQEVVPDSDHWKMIKAAPR